MHLNRSLPILSRCRSGTIVWQQRKLLAAGEIDYSQFLDVTTSAAPSVGHCNTMGTASTMNALAEALGMALPGSSSIPAPYRERGQCAYVCPLSKATATLLIYSVSANRAAHC